MQRTGRTSSGSFEHSHLQNSLVFFVDCDESELTPPIHQDRITTLRLDHLWILDCLPRQLRESLPLDHISPYMLPESVLLAVCRVPHPVDEEVGDEEGGQSVAVPAVLRRRMVCDIKYAVAVGKRHTSQVPEDQHESPFLVVHVPRVVSS
jgi:hypothetical protein